MASAHPHSPCNIVATVYLAGDVHVLPRLVSGARSGVRQLVRLVPEASVFPPRMTSPDTSPSPMHTAEGIRFAL